MSAIKVSTTTVASIGTLHYIKIQYIMLHYIILQYIILHYIILQYNIIHYFTLQYNRRGTFVHRGLLWMVDHCSGGGMLWGTLSPMEHLHPWTVVTGTITVMAYCHGDYNSNTLLMKRTSYEIPWMRMMQIFLS